MLGRAPKSSSGTHGRSWTGPFPVVDPSVLEEIIELRKSIWLNEPSLVDGRQINIEAVMLRNAHDDHGFHWIIKAKESIVAAARLCIHEAAEELPYQAEFHHLVTDIPTPIASLNGLVVHPSMRRQGLTVPLTGVRIEAARTKGARSVIVLAAPNRVAPLRGLGFMELGHSTPVPGYLVPFAVMNRPL